MGYRDTNQNAHASDLRAYSTPVGSTEGDGTHERFWRLLRGTFRAPNEPVSRHSHDLIEQSINEYIADQMRAEYRLVEYGVRWCIQHGLAVLEILYTHSIERGPRPTHIRAVDVNGTIVRVKLRR